MSLLAARKLLALAAALLVLSAASSSLAWSETQCCAFVLHDGPSEVGSKFSYRYYENGTPGYQPNKSASVDWIACGATGTGLLERGWNNGPVSASEAEGWLSNRWSQYIAAKNVCDGGDPDPDPDPDPNDPDPDPGGDPDPDPGGDPDPYPPTPGCGGSGDLACESTQQDNRGLLQQIRDLLRAPLPEETEIDEGCIIYGICPEPEPPDEQYPGFGDAERFRRDRWTAPQLTEQDTNQVLARIEAAGVRISEAAENKMPFALANLVPNFSGGGGGGECQETNLQMLGTSAAIGFCGSAVDTFFAGPVRGMLELLLIVGFYFSVARTYNAA